MESKLKERREQLKLTQREVANEIGIAESAYQRYERMERQPIAKTACKIAKALKTTVEELYGED